MTDINDLAGTERLYAHRAFVGLSEPAREVRMRRVAASFDDEEREMLCALLRKLFDEQNSDVVNALVLRRVRALIDMIPGVRRALGIVERIPFLPNPWEELEALVDREMPELALNPMLEVLECPEQ